MKPKFQNSFHRDSFINSVTKLFNGKAIENDAYIKPLSLFEAKKW